MLYTVLSRSSGWEEAHTHEDTARKSIFVSRIDIDRDWKRQGTLPETDKTHLLFKCHVVLHSWHLSFLCVPHSCLSNQHPVRASEAHMAHSGYSGLTLSQDLSSQLLQKATYPPDSPLNMSISFPHQGLCTHMSFFLKCLSSNSLHGWPLHFF